MKVMIVEDERLISLMESRIVTKAGHRVTGCFSSAEAALSSMDRDLPDVVLMDIKLEGRMDGIEAATKIGEDWGIPVIFASAYPDVRMAERVRKAAPFGFLEKPILPERLKHLLDSIHPPPN